MHWMPWPFSLALISAGRSNAARIAMMAMTTSSSINVNAGAEVRDVSRGRQQRLWAEFILYQRCPQYSHRRGRGQSAGRAVTPAGHDQERSLQAAELPNFQRSRASWTLHHVVHSCSLKAALLGARKTTQCARPAPGSPDT